MSTTRRSQARWPYASTWNRNAIARRTGRSPEDNSWGIKDPMWFYDGPYCAEESETGDMLCTRIPGHTGRHAAGNGDDQIIGVWY